MRIQCKFVAGAATISSFPPPTVPEIAFCGRSNVGKSSLLNAIVGASVAKVSSKPGRTRQINFFLSCSGIVQLVDLPGYGYSEAGKMKTYKYLEMVSHYLMHRSTLRKIGLLIDSRRGMGPLDRDFLDWLSKYEIPYHLILTKIDKISDAAIKMQQEELEWQLQASSFISTIPVSSKSGVGLDKISRVIFSDNLDDPKI